MSVDLESLELGCGRLEGEHYKEGAQALIQRLVPHEILNASHDSSCSRFNDMLPLLHISELRQGSLSLLLLCKYRQNGSQFFYEMVSRHLLPGKQTNIELFFTSDVRLPKLTEDLLSVSELVVQIRSVHELEEVRRNLKQIENEIRLGIVSHYHARRILEFKGLSSDGKTAMIQEKIGSLIQSRSKEFDGGIYSEMQQFLVQRSGEFKKLRDYHHISRMISNLYAVRKLLSQSIEAAPNQRHVLVKFFKTRLLGQRPVLGVLAGLNLLNEHELFDKQHLVAAIRHFLPTAKAVEGSTFTERVPDTSIQINYLEVETESGADFTHEEIQLLRLQLPQYLEAHIEQLAHPIFMPRNEEEVLRNLMALSRQLRFVTDRPQLIISFDEQTADELCFTVVLLRVSGQGSVPLPEQFKAANLSVSFDRIRRMGSLGRKHAKEAAVFRMRVKSGAFLRSDHSLDLYRARQYVLNEVSRVLGEVRDYNGGMIEKQNEQLEALKRSLGRMAERHLLLLEKFYHALYPAELRSVLDADALKQFFLLLVQFQKRTLFVRKKWLGKREAKRAFVIVSAQDASKLKKKIDALKFSSYQLLSFSLDMLDGHVVGYLLQSEAISEQDALFEAVANTLCPIRP